MAELILTSKDLMLVHNALARANRLDVSLRSPFYNLDLMRYSVEREEVRDIAPGWKFTQYRDQALQGASSFLQFDSAGWSALKDCLLSSNFIRYHNWDGARSAIFREAEEASGSGMHPRPIAFGIDTNLAYNRLISRNLPLTLGDRKLAACDLHFVVSVIVKGEVDSHIDRKYSRETVDEMERLFRNELAREFSNGSVRTNRHAKSAAAELDYLDKTLGATTATYDGKVVPEDKEAKDRAIAGSYAEYRDETHVEPVVLTADQDMSYHMRANNIPCIVLEIPHSVPGHMQGDAYKWCDLVFDLATTFGVIEIQGVCTILSEWRGKTYVNYMNEELKVIFTDVPIGRQVQKWKAQVDAVRAR